MNLEQLENVANHIETENKSEKREILFEKISQISLVYADKKFKEIKKKNDDYKFSNAIKDFTPIENIILNPIFSVDGFNYKDFKEKIDLFLQDFYNQIDSTYQTENYDLDKIFNLINLKKDSIKKYLGVENYKEVKNDDSKWGTRVLKYNIIENPETDPEGKYSDLEKFGFSKFDNFLDIHVEDFYKTKEKNLGTELINHDLGVVAEHIVDENPGVAAVLGKSWLLSTPLADRLGFKVIESEAIDENDLSTWPQFIDKNGQINQKRLNKFLETGELPYKSVKAYIPTEDFLKKYLPKNRRGKINLKEIDKEKEKILNEITKGVLLIKNNWEKNLENDEQNFEEGVKKNKSLNKLLDFLKPDDKVKYLNFFKKMFDKKVPWLEFNKYKSEEINDIDEKIKKAIKLDLFKDKEIIIN